MAPPRPGRHEAGRARAYALLARLAGAGISSAREREAAAGHPSMAEAIATYPDPDALAADHQHVFGFSCPPFESAMLDPDGQLGGETSAGVREALASAGVAEGPRGEEPDHLAAQLYALALLAGAEADALEDGEAQIAARLRARARHLLDAHLLRWLPSYALAVRRAERAWPAALVGSIEEVALEHRSTLGPGEALADLAFALPPLALSLDDESTGLADIARLLARPARAGALISRDDVARLGRASGTPRGFGERAVLLENLLRAGAQLGSLDAVLAPLSALLADTRRELDAPRLADVPPPLSAPWRARIDETRLLLERVRQASGSLA